jgi:outer membrane protein assembly factor BamA
VVTFKHACLCAGVLTTIVATSGRTFAQDAEAALPRGWIVRATPGIFTEPYTFRHFINSTDSGLAADREPVDGFYPEFGNMITGEGWISAGPGYRQRLFSGRAVVDASAAVSWNLYQVYQGQFELPHLAHDRLSAGVQAMYQNVRAVEYFGLGNDSLKSQSSAYHFENGDVLAYATISATHWLSLSGRFGWIPRPELSHADGPRVTVPNTVDLFTQASAPGLRSPRPFLHGDVSLAADWRDHTGHPTRGGLYRVGIAAYSDRDDGTYSFRRYEIEAAQFVPLFTPRWILALHGWEVFSDTSAGDLVPFYLMPSLGGKNTLRGYQDYRFHDRNMQVFNVESRWAVWTHVDLAVFADVGKTAPRVSDLDFSHLKDSYGAGFRVHNATSTLLRVDLGHSVDGWRLFVKVSDPFKRTTPFSGRSSVVPFVP